MREALRRQQRRVAAREQWVALRCGAASIAAAPKHAVHSNRHLLLFRAQIS